MISGTVIRVKNGFYFVIGPREEQIVCRLRGRLKRNKAAVVTGDKVVFCREKEDENGIIEELLPRNNYLARPEVANVDQVLVVVSLIQPDLNLLFLDKILTLITLANIKPIICFNKIDIVDHTELEVLLKQYLSLGYCCRCVSAKNCDGITELRDMLVSRVTVFAGPSGVGKSSLLNAIAPECNLAVGELSNKIKRGRHTTTSSRLLLLYGNSFVVDTPGFTAIEFADYNQQDIATCFNEFSDLSIMCRYRGCTHIHEPDCAVKECLGLTILPSRYYAYKNIIKELNNKKLRGG